MWEWFLKVILSRYLPQAAVVRVLPFVLALLKLQQKGEVSLSDTIGNFQVSLSIKKWR